MHRTSEPINRRAHTLRPDPAVAAAAWADPAASRDPLHLIKDFSRVTESLAAAVQVIIPPVRGDELDNPESATTYSSALTDLDGAAAGLHDLHSWF
ncbi:hypothetical protein ACFV4N_23715 [Actinosynnema sp. NPDC059797]